MGENGGSNLRTVAKFISSSYDVELDQECDLSDLLKIAAKKSLTRGLVIHNAETSAFKAVVGKKGMKRYVVMFYFTWVNSSVDTNIFSKHERKEERERERREKKERRRERKEKKLRKLQLQKNVSSSTEESPKVGGTCN